MYQGGEGMGRRGRGLFLLFFLGLILLLLIWFGKYKGVPTGPEEMEDGIISLEDKNSALYREIKWRSGEYEIGPIDARVDAVWKAIPGYNGRAVDVDASCGKMR